MNIKKLDLQGFKSFAERTKIIFHSGITAIVGPNGTGKSNIVDALLWVLGAKRFKSLRGERSEDVIFNGNTQKAPMGMADVRLTLGNGEEMLVINHRSFRSGESEYRMDGKVVRLKDIQDVLWKTGIGEAEYFVIEQGSIGDFLSSKPGDKRVLMEEAAGTAYYKDKKRQAQNKLQNSEQNLERLKDIIAEVLKAKNSLQRQAREAVKYKALREKIRRLTVFHYAERIDQRETSQGEATRFYQKCLEEENASVSQLKSKEKSLAEARKDVWIRETTLKEEQKNFFDLKTRISRIESEKDKEDKRLDFIEEKIIRVKESQKEFNQELASLTREKESKENEQKTLQDSLSKALSDLTAAENESHSSRQTLDAKQKSLEILREEYLQKVSVLIEIKNESVKVEKEKELALRQQEKLKTQLKSEVSQAALKENAIKVKIQEESELKKHSEILRREIEAGRRTFEEVSSSLNEIQGKCSKLKMEKEQTFLHLNALEQLKQQQIGGQPSSLPGGMGLLSDLIDISPDKAPLVDAFWKDEAQAVLIQAEDFLKGCTQNQLNGRFLLHSSHLLEELPRKTLKDPRVLGFLTASVRPNEKVKDVFPHLREAVIVRDIKTAVELWLDHPSMNFVTVGSDVLLSSGLLKLGKKTEGLFSLNQEIKALKENIARVEKNISPLETQAAERYAEKQKLEKFLEQNSTDLDRMDRQSAELDREKNFGKQEKEKILSRIKVLEQELSVLAESTQELNKREKDLSEKISHFEKNSSSLKKTIDDEEKAFSALQDKNSSEMRSFFEWRSTRDVLKEKIQNSDQQIQALSSRMQDRTEKRSSLEKDLQMLGEEREKAQEHILALEKEAAALEKEIKVKESLLTEQEANLKDAQGKMDTCEAALERFREKCESAKEERVQWEIKKAERTRDLANLEESCWQDLKKTLEEVKKEVSAEGNAYAGVEESLAEAQEKLSRLKAVNLMAEEEYLAQKKRHEFLIQQKTDLQESINSTKMAIKKIDQESRTQFLKALGEVNNNFKDVFALLFEGGHAEIRLTDESEPLESGIEIIAQPPGKKLQSLSLLSGGEKSLTSLAFFFALFRYKPTPFCILDEVDAALDEVNLTRFLNLMKKIKTQTQFIIITHNFKSMEVADYIYGTTMSEPSITNLYSVKLDKKEGREEKIEAAAEETK